jgi:hypothetical protein
MYPHVSWQWGQSVETNIRATTFPRYELSGICFPVVSLTEYSGARRETWAFARGDTRMHELKMRHDKRRGNEISFTF